MNKRYRFRIFLSGGAITEVTGTEYTYISAPGEDCLFRISTAGIESAILNLSNIDAVIWFEEDAEINS